MRKIINSIKNMKRKLNKYYHTKRAIRGIKAYKEMPNVNNKSNFNSNTYLGHNCHFNGMVIRGGGKVVIGDNFHSGNECTIITQNHNINGEALPYDESYVIKDVEIGDNVWLGSRVMILAGVSIGEGAVIQAGSVVVSDIPPLAIAGGHPAKVFSSRNETHYFSLKNLGKFH